MLSSRADRDAFVRARSCVQSPPWTIRDEGRGARPHATRVVRGASIATTRLSRRPGPDLEVGVDAISVTPGANARASSAASSVPSWSAPHSARSNLGAVGGDAADAGTPLARDFASTIFRRSNAGLVLTTRTRSAAVSKNASVRTSDARSLVAIRRRRASASSFASSENLRRLWPIPARVSTAFAESLPIQAPPPPQPPSRAIPRRRRRGPWVRPPRDRLRLGRGRLRRTAAIPRVVVFLVLARPPAPLEFRRSANPAPRNLPPRRSLVARASLDDTPRSTRDGVERVGEIARGVRRRSASPSVTSALASRDASEASATART